VTGKSIAVENLDTAITEVKAGSIRINSTPFLTQPDWRVWKKAEYARGLRERGSSLPSHRSRPCEL
jgi:hypothetical protein